MKKMSKDFIKQFIMLMVLAALLEAAVFNSESVFKALTSVLSMSMPFVIGGSLAYGLNLPMRFIENKALGGLKGRSEKLKRPLALLLTLVAVAALLGIVTALIVPNVMVTWELLTRQMPGYLMTMADFLEGIRLPGMKTDGNALIYLSRNWTEVQDTIKSFISSGMPAVLGSTVEVVGNVAGGFVNGIIAFVFAILVLLDKERLARQGDAVVNRYLKPGVQSKVRHVLDIMNQKFAGFITGQCMDAVVLGVMFMIVLSILRMPYSIAIGAVICITGVIPIVGAMIGLIFGVFTIFMVSPTQALIFIIVFFVVQQIESNMIYPKIVGDKVGLPAMWVIFAITIGGSLMGIAGMLIFIPIMSTVYTLIKEDVNR